MCGIAGVITWDDRYRVDRDTLARMSARLAHRGPDGEGVYLSHDQEASPARPQAGLVHRRLAVIDPDPRANQPFTDHQGRWIVFNGEIYNFRELRAELKGLKPDYEWRTDCDTEVLLVAYDVWGEKCVDRLNGMFAFAVWDGGTGELFLARDRMGQKPLYFALPRGAASGAIAFASELAALREVPWAPNEVCPYRLYVYLRWGFPERNSTLCGCAKVGPGQTMSLPFAGRPTQSTPYFVPDRADSRTTAVPDTVAVDSTRRLVRQAVARQLVADVPIGCFLSGGVDSSIVAASMTAAAAGGQPVHTFSVGFDDRRYDETEYAARVAAHLGTRHHQFLVRPDATADLPKISAAFGEPFADSSALPTHYLARETRRHVKVALSGDGGDELFGGYDRYRAMAITERIRRNCPFLLPPLGRFAGGPIWRRLRGHPKSRVMRLKRLLSSVPLPPGLRYAKYLEIFDHGTSTDLLFDFAAPSSWAGAPGIGLELFLDNRSAVEAALASDRAHYLPEDLLMKVDRASMLHALEVRSPFMDHELVQFAAGLTTDQLLKDGPKRMLREAFAADLPAWVFKRRKMGFAVPIGDWFRDRRNAVRAMLHDSLLAADSFAAGHFRMETVRRLLADHDAGRADHGQRLYALLMLELWWRTQR